MFLHQLHVPTFLPALNVVSQVVHLDIDGEFVSGVDNPTYVGVVTLMPLFVREDGHGPGNFL